MTALEIVCCASICGGIAVSVLAVWVFRFYREVHLLMHEVKAERLMLRFCKRPNHQNYAAVWAFLKSHEVRLMDLDWPLVERFNRSALKLPDVPNKDTPNKDTPNKDAP